MPKPLTLDPDKKRKKKRKKRKIDYTVYLVPPVIPNKQCPHTVKAMDASMCSQCMMVKPSVTHYPPQTDWWAEDTEEVVEDITLEELEGDDDGVDKVYVELADDVDLML